MTKNTEHYHLERNHPGTGNALIERPRGAVGRAMNVEQKIACALEKAKDVQLATQW